MKACFPARLICFLLCFIGGLSLAPRDAYANRYYGTELGRFLSRDPVGYVNLFFGLYESVASRPTIYVDSLGYALEDLGEKLVTVSVQVSWKETLKKAEEAIAKTVLELEKGVVVPKYWGGITMLNVRSTILQSGPPVCGEVPFICCGASLYICNVLGKLTYSGTVESYAPDFNNLHLLNAAARAALQRLEDHVRRHENVRRAISMVFFGRDYPLIGYGIDCDERVAKRKAILMMQDVGKALDKTIRKLQAAAQAAWGAIDKPPGLPPGTVWP